MTKSEIMKRQFHNLENTAHLDEIIMSLVKIGFCSYDVQKELVIHKKGTGMDYS